MTRWTAEPTQIALARTFQELHRSESLLVLPNAWDAGSALLFERAGFPAVGTTSAGIAYTLGYPDVQHVSLDELLAVQTRMVKRLTVPLSVDMEAGYGAGPQRVAASVRRVVAAGAVGVNIEDGRDDGLAGVREQAEVIAEVKALKDEMGVPFVINARTDSFWLGVGDAASNLAESVRRGNAYLAAGADCVFVPGDLGADAIGELVADLDGPLNVIAAPRCPKPVDLEAMGVARLSVGSAPARATLGVVRRIAGSLRAGDLSWVHGVSPSYAEANEIFG